MSKKSLGDKVLPAPFIHALDKLIDVKGRTAKKDGRIVSKATIRKRRYVLKQSFGELRVMGYNPSLPEKLTLTHVKALMNFWVNAKRGPSTLQNSLSILRVFCGWIDKGGMIPASETFVTDKALIQRSAVTTINHAWTPNNVDPAEIIAQAAELDKRLAIYLRLMRAFGLRLREAIALKPGQAICSEGAWLAVRDGTKGGRQRMVPIENDYQKETLVLAEDLTEPTTGRIHKRGNTHAQVYERTRYQMRKMGLTRSGLGVTCHGLRHEYAQDSYEDVSHRPSPIAGGDPKMITHEEHKKACHEVMERLGHVRTSVSASYYGSYGHKLRGSIKKASEDLGSDKSAGDDSSSD